MDISPDGHEILTGSSNPVDGLQIWDLRRYSPTSPELALLTDLSWDGGAGGQPSGINEKRDFMCQSCRFFGPRYVIATGYGDNIVRVLDRDVNGGGVVSEYQSADSQITAMGVDQGLEDLVVGDNQGRLICLDAADIPMDD